MISETVKTAVWVAQPPTAEDIRDVVLMARNRGYVENDLRASFAEAMRFHARECKALYRTAWAMDLWLSQETAFGMKWGKR